MITGSQGTFLFASQVQILPVSQWNPLMSMKVLLCESHSFSAELELFFKFSVSSKNNCFESIQRGFFNKVFTGK